MGAIHIVKGERKRTWRNHAPELPMTSPLEKPTEHNMIIISVMLFHKPLVLPSYRPTKLGKKNTILQRRMQTISWGL